MIDLTLCGPILIFFLLLFQLPQALLDILEFAHHLW